MLPAHHSPAPPHRRFTYAMDAALSLAQVNPAPAHPAGTPYG